MADYTSEVDEYLAKNLNQRQMLVDTEPNRRRGPNPQRARGLAALERMRQSDGKPIKLQGELNGDKDWGYVGLCIPELDYYVLLTRNPDLKSKDKETRNKAWRKFMDSPESLPYRPDHRGRKVNDGIIVK